MIDINILRKNPEILYESQRRRFQGTEIIDNAKKLDEEWRFTLKESNDLKSQKNKIVRQIAENTRKGLPIDDLRAEALKIDERISKLEENLRKIENERDQILMKIPNIVDFEAPVAPDDAGNKPILFWGKARVYKGHLENFKRSSLDSMDFELIDFKPLSHVDLLQQKDFVDLERAAKVAGSRFYYLKRDLVLLELSLQLYALKFLAQRGFKIIEPPYMLNRYSMEGATDFSAFEDTIYKIEGDELYLIATSEHPLAAMHSDEILEENSLPLLYGGISPCFRREAGAHGKDTKGIFRVHQFNKIEQFAYTKPEDSKNFHKMLLENAMEFFKSLEIPFRVVDIATGDLGNVASRKFDIEAWYPAQGQFREVVSASNVLDYQARRLKIRYRTKEGNKFVHTLNSTLVATTRALVAIVENFQESDGRIIVPKVLRDIVGKDEI